MCFITFSHLNTYISKNNKNFISNDGWLSTVVTKHVGLFYGHRRYLYAGFRLQLLLLLLLTEVAIVDVVLCERGAKKNINKLYNYYILQYGLINTSDAIFLNINNKTGSNQ